MSPRPVIRNSHGGADGSVIPTAGSAAPAAAPLFCYFNTKQNNSEKKVSSGGGSHA